jgi:sterol desaturase/sphingolipid hydroxylase (fatty acid hydroxylase superfamily)
MKLSTAGYPDLHITIENLAGAVPQSNVDQRMHVAGNQAVLRAAANHRVHHAVNLLAFVFGFALYR